MKKEAVVISVANHKGGVGKTTTCANVGAILSKMGMKVLLVDLDPQYNLTSSLLRTPAAGSTVYEALTGREPLQRVSVSENLDLVPSSLTLAKAELELSSAMAREHILAGLLSPYRSQYDYILIDCSPSLGLLTLNALTASARVIIPLTAEILPFNGLTMMKDFISMVSLKLNPKLRILGILITRWEETRMSRDIEAGLRSRLGRSVFQTKIRKNIRLAEAPLEAVSVSDYAPRSNGAADYNAFVKELTERLSSESEKAESSKQITA